ncbi:MAG: cytidine deaminase [Lactobacillus sp.]|jgi:cytidine deaminase|nr:cytidine deaminase [Lactobacillus sp.]
MTHTDKLFELAVKARKNAYAPYSGFKVGASILSDKNNYYAAADVENISYPCGACAETGAISAMISAGDKKIKEILVIADGKDLITPCGACLQRIKEFSTSKTLIHLASLKGVQKTFKVSDMLPHAFEEEGLKK